MEDGEFEAQMDAFSVDEHREGEGAFGTDDFLPFAEVDEDDLDADLIDN